jgi:hypothetical protein
MRNNQLIRLAGVLVLGLVVAGCSKKKGAATATNAAAEPANPAASPDQARVEREASFQTQDLQLSVEAYEKIYKRKPASLEQMVREGFLASLPPAPSGKRFTLDPATARVSVVPR